MSKEKYKNIILGTGSYSSVHKGNTVSITGDGGNAWGYYGPAYKKMAPRLVTYLPYAEGLENINAYKEDLLRKKEYLQKRKKLEDRYIESFYETRLKGLDVEELLEILYLKFGEKIILLCHEPIEEFCHRRVYADYIEIKTGIYIPEVEVDEKGNVKKLVPIRYKNRLKKFIDKK